MWVMAFYLADFTQRVDVLEEADPAFEGELGLACTVGRDEFVRCCGPEYTIALPLPDAEISPEASRVYISAERLEAVPPGPERTAILLDAGKPVLAALCLGTSGVSYADEQGNYFDADFEDITADGYELLAALYRLYGRKPVLVTYLDT